MMRADADADAGASTNRDAIEDGVRCVVVLCIEVGVHRRSEGKTRVSTREDRCFGVEILGCRRVDSGDEKED